MYMRLMEVFFVKIENEARPILEVFTQYDFESLTIAERVNSLVRAIEIFSL